MVVSIPQAVSTVATLYKRYIVLFIFIYVSIPQAVSTVATNGIRYIGNVYSNVSIPQAVSTVATYEQGYSYVHTVYSMFQYRKR